MDDARLLRPVLASGAWSRTAIRRSRSKRTGRIEIETVAAGQELRTAGYDWEDWNVVSSHERRKAGWDVLAAEFDRTAAAPKRR